jgi:hypothetical protein
MKTFTLVVLNEQGASEETRGHETLGDVLAQLGTWSDPENLQARVFDSDGGRVFEGPAEDFAAGFELR